MKNTALFIFFLSIAIPVTGQNPKTEVTRFSYQINTQSITPQPVDTLLTGSQNHLPLFSSFGSWSDLGNNGLPAITNQYPHTRQALDPKLFEGTDGYGTDDSNLIFYSANSPYSLLNYNSGGTADKNGQTIRALFARNLKRKGNITVFGKYFNSEGHFNRQKGNSSTIQANYILNRKNYNLITGFSRYSFGFMENGGLASDEELVGANWPSTLSVNLSGAATKMSFLTLQGVQTGSILLSGRPRDTLSLPDSVSLDSLGQQPLAGKRITLMHTFRISDVSRKYSDSNTDSSFYQNTYFESGASNDSVRFLSWTNDISLVPDTMMIGKFPVFLKGGINPDFFRYQYDSLLTFGYSLGLNGRISRKMSRGNMDVSGKWIALGYPAGDYSLTASYSHVPGRKDSSSIIRVELFAYGNSPDPIIREFSSNHFRWSNDFTRQHEAGVKITWNMPAIRSSVDIQAVTNTGRIYFDTTGMPAQLTRSMAVFSVKGSKGFAAGPFRSTVSALAQYTSSDEIRLPLLVASTSTFMHHDIHFPSTGGELQVEYGLDLTYTSGFHGYAYMPATGVFFAQNERILGNYPALNVFAQMKVKRTRIFVEWCQTFADLMPLESFAVLHYPSMRPHLKYGIYWHFYD